MLTEKHIQQLKRTDISKDGRKTQERVGTLWKSASAEQKQKILDLAGVIAATVYRAYRTGCVSAKLVISLAQTLNINPFYFTGETDTPSEFSDDLLRKLLLRYNYKKLVAEAGLKRSYSRREESTEAAEPASTAPGIAEPGEVSQSALQPLDAAELSMDDIQILLHGLAVQCKAGIPAAKEKMKKVKLTLLS